MNFAATVASAAARIVFAAALLCAAPAFSQASDDAFPNKSITVYIADFDLAASTAPVRAAATRAAASANASLPANAPPATNATAPATAVPASAGSADAPSASQASTPAPDGAKTDGTRPDAAKPDPPIIPATDDSNPTAGTETPAATVGASPAATPPQGTPPAVTSATVTTAGGSNAAAASGTSSSSASTAAGAGRPNAKKPDPPSDDPRVRTAKFIDLTATTFVKVLENAGYSVKRLRSSASAPANGVVIRGVFAQVDPSAGIRRAVYEGTVTDPSMLLFVGVGNLAKPQQTLYQVVSGSPNGTLGPLIAVSAYAPVSRYELEHEPSEESLRHTAEQFAGDLTRLLNANPLAFGQE